MNHGLAPKKNLVPREIEETAYQPHLENSQALLYELSQRWFITLSNYLECFSVAG